MIKVANLMCTCSQKASTYMSLIDGSERSVYGGKAQQIIKSIDTRNCLFAAN